MELQSEKKTVTVSENFCSKLLKNTGSQILKFFTGTPAYHSPFRGLTPQWREVQRIRHKYNGSFVWYSLCTALGILDNCFTELIFCGFSCFPFLAASFFFFFFFFFFCQLLKLPPGHRVK